MTFIGKLIVGIFTTMSLLMLIVAAATYTQRIDRFNRKDANNAEIVGQITKLQNRLGDLITAKSQAETRWGSSESLLTRLEVERPRRQAFYAGQLKLIETGTSQGQAVARPVQELAIDEKGELPWNQPTGRTPVEIRQGTPLQSLLTYDTLIKDQHGKIADAQAEVKKLIDEQKDLTNQVIDTDQKGLRTLIREQTEIERIAVEGVEYLQPFLTNRRAESQLLAKRRGALESRLAELKTFFGVGTEQ